MLKNLRPGKLQDLAKEQIKSFIVDTGLKSGDQLPTESNLAEKLGISKTTVREALKALENVGILESRHGVGTFIRQFSYEVILENLPYSLESELHSLREIVEVRACLERYFIARDMDKYTDRDREELGRIYGELDRITGRGSLKEEIDLHSAYHCALYTHCGNRLLIKLIRIFSTLQQNLLLANKTPMTDPENFRAQHRQLTEAIQRKDAAMAAKLMESHFDDVLRWIDQDRAGAGGAKEVATGSEPGDRTRSG